MEAQGDVLVVQPCLGEVRIKGQGSKLQNKTLSGAEWCNVAPSALLPAQALAPSNMHSRFSTLLWLEELHAEKEMKEFALHCAFLEKGGGHLHLEVPSLSEGRPSLIIGERVRGSVV